MDTDAFINLEYLRKTLLLMPAVTEKRCYGTPGFYVSKKLFARMKEDGETLVIQSFEREKWMEKDPDIFFITDHYLNYDYVLVNLQKVSPHDLTTLLTTAWYNCAPKKIRGI